MDRLTALVALRFKLELRGLSASRQRLAGLLLVVPFSLLMSLFGAALAYFGVRGLQAAYPELLLPLASLAATAMALFWALAPLMSGLAFVETHDLSRLVHFPVPGRVLVLSSLLSNLLQPLVLAELPVVLALSAALAPRASSIPLTLCGVALSFACILVSAQLAGLALHGLSRNRRLWDLALFFGLGLGLLFSLLPLLLMAAGGGAMRVLSRLLVVNDLLRFSPFGFGLRAAVHGGRGELGAWALNLGAGLVALVALLGLCALVMGRVYTGELAFGAQKSAAARPSRMRFGGPVGTLLEKDLRVAWREPALKAVMLFGLLGPVLFLVFALRMRHGPAAESTVLMLASFVGLSSFGANIFGLERRGLALLLAFPVARWRILVAKNLVALLLRLPGLVLLGVAALLLAPAALLPAAATIALVTILSAAGLDNFMSLWAPMVIPAPGRNPYGPSSGGRGLGASLLSMLMLAGVLVSASPFVFLAWFPLLYGQPALWALTLPVALGGALAVYAMLVTAAAGQLERREPELLARVLGEE